MKISFKDGSFIHIDKSHNSGKVITITMCGVSSDGNSVTMSSSDLEFEQVEQICEFLQEALKKVE